MPNEQYFVGEIQYTQTLTVL